jgi:hypothetical protein
MSWDNDTPNSNDELIREILRRFGVQVDKKGNEIENRKRLDFITETFRRGLSDKEQTYFDFGTRILDLFYEHFPDKFDMDFIKIFRIMTRSYLAILSSQIADADPSNKPIPRNVVNKIVHELSNELGHRLAEIGLAKPYVEGEHRDKEEGWF